MAEFRARAAAMLPSVDDLVSVSRPDVPLLCLRPAAIEVAARHFVAAFPGDVLYAVKCNPEPTVLRAIWQGGVRHFDCASIGEVLLVRSLLPEAAIHYMHPVKSRAAIRAAWAAGVRDFALDHDDELAKLRDETGPGVGLIVRLAPPVASGARYDLSGKFGATVDAAAELLRAARPHATRLGFSFHVGSQCTDPLAWRRAIALAGRAVDAAGVPLDVLDVGGGFPVAYADEVPPPLGAFFAEIEAASEALDLPVAPRLWAEPGRALVAGGASVVVRVTGRRGDALHINDGVYGTLSDAGIPGFRFPARLIRVHPAPATDPAPLRPFTLFGPTCDSADRMQGPWLLPNDVAEEDWIEIGQLGAYGSCLATGFNTIEPARLAEVRDAPML